MSKKSKNIDIDLNYVDSIDKELVSNYLTYKCEFEMYLSF